MLANHPHQKNNSISRQIERAFGDMDESGLEAIILRCKNALHLLADQNRRGRFRLHWLIAEGLTGFAQIRQNPEEFSLAFSHYRKALQNASNLSHKRIDALYHQKAGYVLFCKGRLLDDRRILKKALSHFDKAIAGYEDDNRAAECLIAKEESAVCASHLGRLSGDIKAIEDSVRALQAILKSQIDEKAVKPATVMNVTAALYDNAKSTRSQRVYEELYAILRKQIKQGESGFLNRSRWQKLYFLFYYQRVCKDLGEIRKDKKLLLEAVDAAKSRAKLIDRKHDPLRRAENLHLMGNAIAAVAAFQLDIGGMIKAIGALECARRIYAACQARINWGRASFDLGNIKYKLCHLLNCSLPRYDYELEFERALRIFTPVLSPELCARAIKLIAEDQFRRQQWSKAIQSFSRLETVLNILRADPEFSLATRQKLVGQFGDYFYMAAYCYLSLNQLQTAIETLDRGRAILNRLRHFNEAKIIKTRSPQDRRALNAAKSRFLRTRRRLQNLSAVRNVAHFSNSRPPGNINEVTQALELAWEDYSSCRMRCGLETTALKVNLRAEFEKLVENTVLVFFVFTDIGSNALIATRHDSGKIQCSAVSLNTELYASLSDILYRPKGETYKKSWFFAYDQLKENIETDETMDRLMNAGSNWDEWHPAYLSWNKSVKNIFKSLWTAIMEPVHRNLLALEVKPDSRVILFPPGTLANLPLHAAGYRINDRWHCFLDHWVVSYAPNLSLLSRKTRRTHPDSENHQPAITIIAAEDHEELTEEPDLMLEEARYLAKKYAHSDVRVFDHKDIALGSIAERLSHTDYFHATTHGVHSWEEPSAAGIELRTDFFLSLKHLEIGSLAFNMCQLAYLSACSSGLIDIYRAPSEQIGLATGFLNAGASRVISTLWPILEDAGFLLALKFYDLFLDEYLHEKSSPAKALRDAQIWLRDVTFRDLAREYGTVKIKGKPWIAMPKAHRHPAKEVKAVSFLTPMMPKGPDNTRPFAMPHEWAGFIISGTVC